MKNLPIVTYWDLPERDRAALTSADVDKYIDMELMQKGVLRPDPLDLIEEPAMPEPELTFYSVVGIYSGGLVFETQEAAEAALKAVVKVDCSYLNNQSIDYVDEDRSERELSVKVVRHYSKRQLDQCRVTIDAALSAKAENKRRIERHEAQQKAMKEALDGLRSDWRECGAKSLEMDRVARTLEEYTRLAGGNESIAMGFLAKAFSHETLVAAEEWHGRSFGVVTAAAE